MKDLLVILVFVAVAVVGANRSSLFKQTDHEMENSSEVTDTLEAGVVTSGAPETPVTPVTPREPELKVTTTPSVPVISGSNSALPLDDQPAGALVTVRSVTFASPGWVAVHDGVTGQPGNTMGASWLPAGTRENVTVELLRPMIAGNTYFLVLHSDDGDKVYNSKIDLALSDSIPFAFVAK